MPLHPSPRSAKALVAGGKVLKTLAPEAPGAGRWAQRYGAELVCVRQRADASGRLRVTTVELVVDTVPIRPRSDALVGLRVGAGERELQAKVKQGGGRWDAQARLWHLPRRVALVLGLKERIVE
jgi:hypothetical protein